MLWGEEGRLAPGHIYINTYIPIVLLLPSCGGTSYALQVVVKLRLLIESEEKSIEDFLIQEQSSGKLAATVVWGEELIL